MMTCKELQEKWDSMPVFGHGYLHVDGEHPLEINIGYEELNQKTLLIIDTGEIDDLPSSKSIIAYNYLRQDGKWAISFRLIRKENEDVFIRLCWDIIESSRDESENVVEYILGRYIKWLKLMEHQRSDMMDASRQKGLIGELIYLQDCIHNIGSLRAIDSWSGPDGADQDFVYDDSWTEVKTVTIAADSVAISSLEQLDVDSDGTLVIYFIDKTTPENACGFTLFEKVIETRLLLSSDHKASEKFEMKLFQYGYKDLKDYEKQNYKLSKKNIYSVTEHFPKLIKTNVPNPIVAAKYCISLVAIDEFMVKE